MSGQNMDVNEQVIKAIGVTDKALSTGIQYFSVLALLTSVLGVAMGLLDYMIEHFNFKKNKLNRIIVIGSCLVPPCLFSMVYPNGFLLALNYAGIMAAVLLILLPTIMVYRGRYQLYLAQKHLVPGGKFLLLIIMSFGFGIMLIELLIKFEALPVPKFN